MIESVTSHRFNDSFPCSPHCWAHLVQPRHHCRGPEVPLCWSAPLSLSVRQRCPWKLLWSSSPLGGLPASCLVSAPTVFHLHLHRRSQLSQHAHCLHIWIPLWTKLLRSLSCTLSLEFNWHLINICPYKYLMKNKWTAKLIVRIRVYCKSVFCMIKEKWLI